MRYEFSSRPAADADFETVSAFPQGEEELFRIFPAADYPLTAAQLREAAGKRHDPTVVTSDGEVAGYANFIKVKPGKFCSIGNVVVAPGFRGRGAGTFLMAAMERTALEKYNVREVSVACFSRNRGAVEFYGKLGYTAYEAEKRVDRNGNPAILIKMKKTLR